MSKQCLDVQQMQHLQELGMKLDYNTLLKYVKFEDSDWLLKPSSDLDIIGISCRYISAYTLQDVLDALPNSIGGDEEVGYWLQIEQMARKFDDWKVSYVSASQDEYLHCFQSTNLIDAAYELLVWCLENKLVETNKNE